MQPKKEIIFHIPLPPSINNGYWGFKGHKRFLTKEAKSFQDHISKLVLFEKIKFGDAPLEMSITIHFPTRRKADISNRIKAIEDAFVHAGLMDDDSQINILHIFRGEIIKGGKCLVKICAI